MNQAILIVLLTVAALVFSALVFSVVFFITKYGDYKNRLEDALSDIEETTHSKDYLLSNINHEVKSSMNSVIIMTELLFKEHNMTGQKLQYVSDIKIYAESLLGTVADILDLNKISESRVQLFPADIDLSHTLKDMISIVSISARTKGLRFIDDIQITSPQYIKADEARLNQIIVNLLSNAFKFTKSGYIKFTVKIEDGNIMFEVQDTGVGIREEYIPLLFAYNEQSEKIDKYTMGETGLGLLVAQKLTEMMGGQIWAESEYSVGSTFRVSIPFVPGDKAAYDAAHSERGYICAPNARVLIVDDMQINLSTTAGLLRLCQISADVAASGPEAINLIKEKDYDIVFMDHKMPEMNGGEATKIIRLLGGKYEKLPIIALTAHTAEEIKESMISSGMNDYLSKPIDIDRLMEVLHKWLPEDKMESDSRKPSAQSEAGYSEIIAQAYKIPGIDVKLALERLNGTQKILENGLMYMAYFIEPQLKKMDNCLSECDLRSFNILAHGIKSALAGIGAMYFSELAAELEITAKTGNLTVAIKKFSVFASIMEGFAYDLQTIFPKSENKEKPRGDSEFLAQKVSDIIGNLNNFEANDALLRLNDLSHFTFGNEADELLAEVRGAVQGFNFEKAISMLIKQLSFKAGKF